MKKIIFTLLCFTFLTSEVMKSQVCYGIRGEGSEIIISVSSSGTYNNPGTANWLVTNLTVSWSSALGDDVIQSSEGLNGFPFTLETGSPETISGTTYKKLGYGSGGPVYNLMPGESVDVFSMTVAHLNISTGDFSIVDTPPITNGEAAFSSAALGNQYTAGTCNTSALAVALPVELLNFTATLKGENTLLNWTTAAEINTDSYQIDRSTDTQNWINIGKVAAQGNTTTDTNYYYTDENAFRNISENELYYRLKITDFDGTAEYSPIRKVRRETTGTVSFFPNPAQEKINLKIESETAQNGTLEIYDQTGKIVRYRELTINSGITELPLSIEKLASGVYFTKLVLNGQIFNDRIVVNN